MKYKLNKKKYLIDWLFTLALFCVFSTTALLVMLTGTDIYKKITINTENSFSGRTAISFIAKQVRQNDNSDSISVVDFDGIQTLKLDDGEFSTYIYYKDGFLSELFSLKGADPLFVSGQPLVALDSFEMEQNSDGTYTFTAQDNTGAFSTITLVINSTS